MKMKSRIMGALLVVGTLYAQSEVDLRLKKEQLEADIRKIDRNIISTDSLATLESERFEAKKSRQVETIAQKKSELDTLSDQLRDIQVQIGREGFKQSRFKMKTENLNSQLGATALAISKKAAEVASLVESGLPWDLESRVSRVRALKRDLEVGTATAEEGTSRLSAMVREEIKFNDEVVLNERSITRNNGELVNVQMLRMGNVWMVYMDATGQMYGRLIKKTSDQGPGYAWVEDLDFNQRKAVREAIEIKMAKRAPELILLPLSLSVSPQEVK
jgi:hypothetical protein